MKIGFDAKRFFNNTSGLGNYSRDLVRILSKFVPQNDYLLYTPKTSIEHYTNLVDSKQIKVPHGYINRHFPNYWRTKRIVSDLKKDQIAIFHGLSGEIPVDLGAAQVKSIVSMHDLIFMRYPALYRPIDRWIYQKKFAYACRQSDKIVAISKQTKNDIIEFFNIPEEKINIIYQGCHEAFKTEKTAAEKEALKKRLGLPNEFLLNVGTIEERKNALSIVKAIENIDIPLVIVGKSTKYQLQLKEFIDKHQMNHRVHFLSGLNMQELSVLYSSALAFIYPSIYEGFGIPIIEALYSGTPVITTNSGVFPEAGGPFSQYVSPHDIEDIRHSINRVIEDTALRQEMRIKGLAYAQQFNDEHLAAQWNAQYLAL
ncbi:glycosyltransferase family 4 protein [Sphingobacterium sp. N143]|uniref:glycosyltransferase family 4 protein n=1 Tax=Sphingobacterium sp. N143 TaxID=2746727 RepID=UPI0025771459|nr:glycosyltransferase family 1 protein [Sphingobacterium sp. N143]MDM1293474.1 glycosyltransferase family 4 protein [Sphingobacterium sp. N143]